MHVTILPFCLKVCKVQKHQTHLISHAVMKLLLFPESHQFLSFTESEEGLSLVLDENALETVVMLDEVAKSVVQVCDITWRPVQIVEGSLGYTSVGIVHALSEPLAKAGITIFNLSTYQTDFTLVPEERIYEAVNCLTEKFAILTEGLQELKKNQPLSPKPDSSSTANSSASSSELRHHSLSLPPSSLYLCSLKKEFVLSQAAFILKAMFFPTTVPRFFSYTETEDEVSILLDKEAMDAFTDEEVMTKSGDSWRLVKVDGDLGFAETGIVHAMTETISYKAHISLFYVSTYVTDYVLVPEEKCDETVQCLKGDHRFTLNAE